MVNEVTYSEDGKVAHIDGYKFTRDRKTGYYLSTKPIDGLRTRLHVYVWRKHFGDVPEGYHVHHRDHDKGNNEIANLEAIAAFDHVAHHGETMTDAQRKQHAAIMKEKAAPKATEWHKSDEGREWHKSHGRATWESRLATSYTCDNCGETFESRKAYGKGHKFCSNKCRTAFRRKSGVDNITFACSECAEPITCNRYFTRRRCESCGAMNDVPRGMG